MAMVLFLTGIDLGVASGIASFGRYICYHMMNIKKNNSTSLLFPGGKLITNNMMNNKKDDKTTLLFSIGI